MIRGTQAASGLKDPIVPIAAAWSRH